MTVPSCEMRRELVNLPAKTRHHKPNDSESTEPAMTNRFRHSPILALITLVLFYLGGCATVNLDEHMAQSRSRHCHWPAMNVIRWLANAIY